jgi:hypothetical protein
VVFENGRYFLLATVPAGARDEFESELSDRHGILDWTAVGRTGDRWFYQLLLEELPTLYDLYDPTRFDVVSIESKVTDEGGLQRLLFPDYDAFERFRRRCERANVPFRLLTISSNPERVDGTPKSGLTDRQYEALTVAFDRGYYETPRRASTRQIAEELGISASAVSKLLQRAERRLVGQTVDPEYGLE